MTAERGSPSQSVAPRVPGLPLPEALDWSQIDNNAGLGRIAEATDYEILSLLRKLARAALSSAPGVEPLAALRDFRRYVVAVQDTAASEGWQEGALWVADVLTELDSRLSPEGGGPAQPGAVRASRPAVALLASHHGMLRDEALRLYRVQHDDECNCEACNAYDDATDEVEPVAAPGVEPERTLDEERSEEWAADVFPNGFGCSQCDGTGFMPQTMIDELRAKGYRVPWSAYPPGTPHLDPDSDLAKEDAAYAARWGVARLSKEETP